MKIVSGKNKNLHSPCTRWCPDRKITHTTLHASNSERHWDWIQSLTRCFVEWVAATCERHSWVHSIQEAIFKIKSTSFLREVKKRRAMQWIPPGLKNRRSVSGWKSMQITYENVSWLISCQGKTTTREQQQQNFLPILSFDLPAAHKDSHEAHKPST